MGESSGFRGNTSVEVRKRQSVKQLCTKPLSEVKHCYRQNDFYFQVDSHEGHFNVSVSNSNVHYRGGGARAGAVGGGGGASSQDSVCKAQL